MSESHSLQRREVIGKHSSVMVQKEIEVFISQFCVGGQRRGLISGAQGPKSHAIG